MNSKQVKLIICEGDSEFAYVQELNRYLNEKGGTEVLIPCNAGGGGFRTLRHVCRNKKTKRNGRTFIFADKDIYVRNDNGNGEMYEAEHEELPPFLFQTWNFEDFLLMHFPEEVVGKWREASSRNGHLVSPKHSKEYKSEFADFCEANNGVLHFDLPYAKGDMPFGLTDEHLEHLAVNNAVSQSFPHSEFADLVKQLQQGLASGE